MFESDFELQKKSYYAQIIRFRLKYGLAIDRLTAS